MSTPTLVPAAAVAAMLVAGSLGCACRYSDAEKSRRHLEAGKQRAAAKDWRRAILHLKLSARHAPNEAEPLYQLGMAQLAAHEAVDAFASFHRAARMQPPHIPAKLRLVELMIASGDRELIDASHQHIDAVLAAEPRNLDALHARAAALFTAGDLSGAEAAANEVIRLQPGSAAARLTLALVRMMQKDYGAAELSLKEALDWNPGSASAAVALGRFYVLTGRRQEAETQFRRAVEIDDRHAPALVELAALRMAAGQQQKAGEIYGKLSRLPEREYQILHAIFLAQTGDKAGALRELERIHNHDREDRAVRSHLVRAYVDAGRAQEAERLLTRSLEKNPKDVDALLQTVELFPESRNTQQLESDLMTVLRYWPRSAMAHYLLAQVYKRRGARHTEMLQLQEALDCDPALLIARLALAELQLVSGDAEGSLRLLDTAPPAHRPLLPVIVQRNWTLLELKRDGEAAQALTRVLSTHPLPELILQQAVLAIRANNRSAAVHHLEEVLKQRPEDVRALHLLAGVYAGEGRFADAARRVRQQAEAYPNSSPLWECLGKVLADGGDPAGAMQAYEAALRLSPERWSLQLELVRLDVAAQRVASARKRLQELKPPVSDDPAALLLRGIVEEQSGNAEAAIACYRKVLETDANNQVALNNLAWKLAQTDSTIDEALQLAQRAREASGAPEIDHTIGWICYRKGLYRSAVDHLSAAAAKAPTARRTHDLALAYLKAGKPALARQTYAAAVAMDPSLPPELEVAPIMTDGPLPPPED